MLFTIASILLLASTAFGAAVPAAEHDKRATALILPTNQVVISMFAPDHPFGSHTWGNVTQVGSNRQSTMVSFDLPNGYSGSKCSLIFENAEWATGKKTFQLFKFIPFNHISFETTATFNSRTGYPDTTLGDPFVIGTSQGPVYTFDCPSNPTTLNYDVVPSNGDVSFGWKTPEGGLKLKVGN